jgi:hypothetical protein
MGTNLESDSFKRIIKKFLVIKGNVLAVQEVFIAKRVIEWIMSATKDPKVVDSFMLDLERHLSGTMRLTWIEEIISNNESDNHDNQKHKKAVKASKGSRAQQTR